MTGLCPAPHRRFLRRARRGLVVTLVAAVVGPAAAAAQTPTQVRDGMQAGVYVDAASADAAALQASVARARAVGIDLAVVVAPDPQPDADAFALRVRQLEVADLVLVFGAQDMGVSSEEIPQSDLARASDAAQIQDATVEDRVDAFVAALLVEPEEAQVPAMVEDLTAIVTLAVVVLGAAVVAEQALRASRRRRRERRGQARA